ncbi:hypothetical protein ABS768_11620 [Flavobacterium sp. ST-75]|uniref:Uncharacterized protein n=1 Tax=Flavobacterium rhizophilum TaxID=3163296 RepID=A0ABW8YD50_9FLAO
MKAITLLIFLLFTTISLAQADGKPKREIQRFGDYEVWIIANNSGYTQIPNPGIYCKSHTSAKEMIAKGVNAIDKNNNILTVKAIAEINIDIKSLTYNWFGGIVYVSAKGSNREPDLKVYQKHKSDSLWKETNLKVFFSKEGNNYLFKAPRKEGHYLFCLGKPAKTTFNKDEGITAGSYKTVYISTCRAFNFKDLKVSYKGNSLSYSAKINDTLTAFTYPARRPCKEMVFEGYYDNNGEEVKLTVPLRKCKYRRARNRDETFYITEESLNPNTEKKKKSVWQWVKKTF